jgi:hypothetical protein
MVRRMAAGVRGRRLGRGHERVPIHQKLRRRDLERIAGGVRTASPS